MPKQIPTAEKTKWLRAYENGDSYVHIAERHEHDVRTVKRGVEEARRLRDVRSAHSELFKEALREHQADLKGVIDDIMAALKVPPLDKVLSTTESTTPEVLHIEKATVQSEASGSISVTLKGEGTLLWELLREHLKRDPLWQILDRWKSAVAHDLLARGTLKAKAKEVLAKNTKPPVLREATEGARVEAIATVDLFYQAALSRALGIPDGPDLESGIRTETGTVLYYDVCLAKGLPEGSEERCKRDILKAYKEFLASPEVKSLPDKYKQAQELTTKAERTVEEIHLMGLVLGQCRVCRRIGV